MQADGPEVRVGERAHERRARAHFETEGTYSEGKKRGAKRPRATEGHAAEGASAHKWQMIHIAPARRRMMERLQRLAKGDG